MSIKAMPNAVSGVTRTKHDLRVEKGRAVCLFARQLEASKLTWPSGLPYAGP